jgi:hypothetical protein
LPPRRARSFAFVEFASKAHADEALKKVQGYKLDKNHTLVINTFAEVSEFLNVPDVAPAIVPPEYAAQEDLNSWLLDPKARDQYALRWADNTDIVWNEPGVERLEPDFGKKGWTDTHVVWSPHGRYLACFHRMGIILFGGPQWQKLAKFGHEGVKLVDFSPCERYLVTWSPTTEFTRAIVVWDVSTGAQMRAFPGPKDMSQVQWPVFKWSHNDAMMARLGDDCIHIYETATMKLLKEPGASEKRTSLKVEGVKEFAWCPTENRMAYWVPELENAPVRGRARARRRQPSTPHSAARRGAAQLQRERRARLVSRFKTCSRARCARLLMFCHTPPSLLRAARSPALSLSPHRARAGARDDPRAALARGAAAEEPVQPARGLPALAPAGRLLGRQGRPPYQDEEDHLHHLRALPRARPQRRD